jgi:hypothetical protein
VIAIVAALLLALTIGVGAQSLSDAARRAGEQRRENAGRPPQVLKPPVEAEDDDHPKLTENLLNRYGRARLTLADFRRRDRAVQARLIAATREVRHYDELAGIFESEPAIISLLDSFRLTPRLYVGVDIALLQIQDRRRSPNTFREPTDREKENFAFVNDRPSSIDRLIQQCRTHEQGVKLWFGAIPSWW